MAKGKRYAKEFGDKVERRVLSSNVIKNEELKNKNGYFEIIDSKGIHYKIPNWTDEEFKEFGLKSFFEDNDGVSAEELFDV